MPPKKASGAPAPKKGQHKTRKREKKNVPHGAAAPLAFFGGIGYLAFFLPAMVRLGPLRVRAVVFVRWPRTGMPRRCRRPW